MSKETPSAETAYGHLDVPGIFIAVVCFLWAYTQWKEAYRG